jgi:hypothetical protein
MGVALPFLRVTAMLFKGYNVIWRYFNLQDSIALAKALPATLALLVFPTSSCRAYTDQLNCGGTAFVSLFRRGIRALRRASFELMMSAGAVRRRAVLVGSGHTLAGAMRQVGLSPDMEVVPCSLTIVSSTVSDRRITVVDDYSALRVAGHPGSGFGSDRNPKLSSLGELVATPRNLGWRLASAVAGHVVRGDVGSPHLYDRTFCSAIEPHWWTNLTRSFSMHSGAGCII